MSSELHPHPQTPESECPSSAPKHTVRPQLKPHSIPSPVPSMATQCLSLTPASPHSHTPQLTARERGHLLSTAWAQKPHPPSQPRLPHPHPTPATSSLDPCRGLLISTLPRSTVHSRCSSMSTVQRDLVNRARVSSSQTQHFTLHKRSRNLRFYL